VIKLGKKIRWESKHLGLCFLTFYCGKRKSDARKLLLNYGCMDILNHKRGGGETYMTGRQGCKTTARCGGGNRKFTEEAPKTKQNSKEH